MHYNAQGHVKFARWNVLDLNSEEWPCAIDLRNNPISHVSSINISICTILTCKHFPHLKRDDNFPAGSLL